MNISLKIIQNVLNFTTNSDVSSFFIDNVSIDSRSMQNGATTLFFALQGPNTDGHIYIENLINKGVSFFVVSEIPNNLQKKAHFLLVPNTLVALQKMAIYYRSLYRFPVIGITGSNGKTIVKEWLNFLLSPEFSIIRSPKSYNSQVGVPLSIMGYNEQNTLGIFEAGISTTNEMHYLQKIVQPTIGILTSIGSAHNEGFVSEEEKIKEKMQLFANSEVVICQKNGIISKYLPVNARIFDWSYEDSLAKVFISEVKITTQQTEVFYTFNSSFYQFIIPFTDKASIENAISCLLVLLYFDYNSKLIQQRMLLLFPVEMRLKVKNGSNNCSIIDDSYSSDYQSLKIALDFLESQKKNRNKTIIISDILQSGWTDDVLYPKVAQLIESNGISKIIGIGSVISKYQNYFKNCVVFDSTEAFISSTAPSDFFNETILIKGARVFAFEKIVNFLEEKTHETILEINLNSLSHNYNFFKSKLKPTTKMMVMIKAFGYGNGGLEIAKLLEYHSVDYLGVAFADEGIALRIGGIKTPIMVLNPESTSFLAIIQHQLEPEIYTIKGLRNFIEIAQQKGVNNYPIHIKIDTGMHRLGFEENHLPELLATLQSTNVIKIESILSHMATSDSLEHQDFAIKQIEKFVAITQQIKSFLNIKPILHILNTSGISNYPEAQLDMVRLGIGLYGVSNDCSEQKKLELVGTLKSIISQIRTIPAGDSVGYGRRFMATKATKIATIPIGYADGISRLWGNGTGFVTINNQKAPIIGSICMDMLMIDVTNIDCKESDPVEIFGTSPTVTEMAEKLQTIPYEIMTSISQRVKRVFYRN